MGSGYGGQRREGVLLLASRIHMSTTARLLACGASLSQPRQAGQAGTLEPPPPHVLHNHHNSVAVRLAWSGQAGGQITSNRHLDFSRRFATTMHDAASCTPQCHPHSPYTHLQPTDDDLRWLLLPSQLLAGPARVLSLSSTSPFPMCWVPSCSSPWSLAPSSTCSSGTFCVGLECSLDWLVVGTKCYILRGGPPLTAAAGSVAC